MLPLTLHLLRSTAAIVLMASCAAQAANEFIYTVQPGDNPWTIAQRYLQSAPYGLQLSRLNRIANDRRLQPGSQLRIPSEWLKLESATVRIAALYGVVLLAPGAATGHAAATGEALVSGMSLRTGAQASATLEFQDGSRILVRQDTDVRLVQSQQRALSQTRLIRLELLRGALENIVTPNADPAGRFEIRSPSAIAAVRGTQFRVSVDNQRTRAEVLQGSVLVGNDAGNVLTNRGSGTDTDAGHAPSSPAPLLAAPDLSLLPDRLERLPINWPFGAVAGATAYRTQIAPDDRFDLVLSDEVSQPARLRALSLADGNYVFRIRAIDADGLEGIAADRAMAIQARPEPPLLIEPAPDAVTTLARPAFRWTQAVAGWNYRLQIAQAGGTSDVSVSDTTVTGAGSAHPDVDLPPGVYQWRVASIDPARNRQGP